MTAALLPISEFPAQDPSSSMRKTTRRERQKRGRTHNALKLNAAGWRLTRRSLLNSSSLFQDTLSFSYVASLDTAQP